MHNNRTAPFGDDHPLTGSPLHLPQSGCSAHGSDLGASIRGVVGPVEADHVREAILSGSLTDPVSLPASARDRAGFTVASPLHGKGQVGYTPATATTDGTLHNQRSMSTGGGGGTDTPSHRRNDPYYPRYNPASTNTTPSLFLLESELEHITTVQVREVSHRQSHTPCSLYVSTLPTTPHAQQLPRPLSASAAATTAAALCRTPIAATVHDSQPPRYPATTAKGPYNSSHTPTHNNSNSMGGSFHCNPSTHGPTRAFSPTLYTSDVPQLEPTLAYVGVACDPAHCLDPEEGGQVVVQRIAQRCKQIAIGKQTVGYSNYLQAVPVAEREVNHTRHPITPRADYDCSKRTFDKVLSEWRKGLHEWDPEKTADGARDDDDTRPSPTADDDGRELPHNDDGSGGRDVAPLLASESTCSRTKEVAQSAGSQADGVQRRKVRDVVLEARERKLQLQQWTPPPPRRASMKSPPLFECGGPQGSGFLAPAAGGAAVGSGLSAGHSSGGCGQRRSSGGLWASGAGHQDLSPMHGVPPGLHGSATSATGSPIYHHNHSHAHVGFRPGFASPQQIPLKYASPQQGCAMPSVRLAPHVSQQPFFPNLTEGSH